MIPAIGVSIYQKDSLMWVFFSFLFFPTGQIPSYKLSGSLSKYVSTVPLTSSVCCSEDHQVNIKTSLETHLC